MREMLLPLCAILLCTSFFFTSCEKESTTDLLPEEEIHEDSPELRRRRKVKICHNGQIIKVNKNAVCAHQAHGDAVDRDRDGYFDIENSCSEGIDCDDYDPDINSGAIEICDNGIDDDCDGLTDDEDDDCSTACIDGELEVLVDPDGTPDTGDEYLIFVHPALDDPNVPWGEFIPTGAISNWDGAGNTQAIVNALGEGTNYAAGLCASMSTDDCNWYLPSNGELNAMYEQLGPSSGSSEIESGIYWSSTETSIIFALCQDFENGEEELDLKDVSVLCRCVRTESQGQ